MDDAKIIVEIKCSSKICENLRGEGLFFETIADALDIKRRDIKEIDIKEKNDKSRSN